MNGWCSGDLIRRHGGLWLRCFLDGRFKKIEKAPIKDEPCPLCKRPWGGAAITKEFRQEIAADIALAIDLPYYRRLVREHRKCDVARERIW